MKRSKCRATFPTARLRLSYIVLERSMDKLQMIGVKSMPQRTLTPTSSQVVYAPLHPAVLTTTLNSLAHLTASIPLAHPLSLRSSSPAPRYGPETVTLPALVD